MIKPRTIKPHPRDIYTADGRVFLGQYYNWDLYGCPNSGQVVTIPVIESCRASRHGDRGYFRGTRSRMSREELALLTSEGLAW